jgi:acetyl esterase/lipase
MKRTLLLTIAAMFSLSIFGQEHTLPLYPAGKVPNWKDAGEKEVAEVKEIVRYSLVQEPNIAVFLPPKRIATGQAVVVCPGGGYGVLAYDWEGTSVAKWLNSKGIAAVVLKYRLPNAKSNITPHLTPMMDAERAIRLVRAHAPEWNVQALKVGVMGFSAGGHLASTLGTHFDEGNTASADSVERHSSRPDFMVLIYPVITMDKQFTHSGSRNNLIGANPTPELKRLYSNELQVSKQTPPTFIVHSTDDKGVPVENSLLFYQALKAKEVPAEMHIYPYGGHGFGLATGRGYLESWPDRCLDWLRSLK